jgi:UDP-N-acetylglucosamine 2-epimerase (non-hydrolysing)
VEEGSNILVGQDPNILKAATAKLLKGQGQKGKIPELWDGRASERIVQFLAELKTPAAVY